MGQRIFDAHLHIIDPAYALVANAGFLPAPFTVEDYRREAGDLGVGGGAVVSGSFQAFDQQYLSDALRALGPSYVGVTHHRHRFELTCRPPAPGADFRRRTWI